MEPTNEERVHKVIDIIGTTDLFLGVVDDDPNVALGIIALMKRAIREYNQLSMEDYITELEKNHLTKL